MVSDKKIHRAFRELIQLYKQNPLEKFFIFTIYQNYTLALSHSIPEVGTVIFRFKKFPFRFQKIWNSLSTGLKKMKFCFAINFVHMKKQKILFT